MLIEDPKGHIVSVIKLVFWIKIRCAQMKTIFLIKSTQDQAKKDSFLKANILYYFCYSIILLILCV